MADNNYNPLWWAYDSEKSTWSPLPAGPMLLPALIICGIIYLLNGLPPRQGGLKQIAGPLASDKAWQRKRERYHELIRLKLELEGKELPWREHCELQDLEHYLHDPHGFRWPRS